MIDIREGNKLTIEFDNPWEQDVVNWLYDNYGPNYFRNHILKLLQSKEQAKLFIEVKKEFEERANSNRQNRLDSGSEPVSNPRTSGRDSTQGVKDSGASE